MEASLCSGHSSFLLSAPTLFRPASSCTRLASSSSSSSSIAPHLRSSRLNHSHKCSWNALMDNALPAKHDHYIVGDFMTCKGELLVAKPTTTVDEALELLVQHRITGLPVVDETEKVIGVVSDFDLLALDSISGNRPADSSLFPEPGNTWKAFKEIQKLIGKTHGKTVGDVMTPSPLVIKETSNLEDAARILLGSQKRRLPVVDNNGKLVGLLTRGNVIKAALRMKLDAEMESKSS